jgi:unsaturated rhamnogalacturonyl hydrolase
MASNEMDIAGTQPIGQGKTVMLDSYFNNEMRKDSSGQMVSGITSGTNCRTVGFHFGELVQKLRCEDRNTT